MSDVDTGRWVRRRRDGIIILELVADGSRFVVYERITIEGLTPTAVATSHAQLDQAQQRLTQLIRKHNRPINLG